MPLFPRLIRDFHMGRIQMALRRALALLGQFLLPFRQGLLSLGDLALLVGQPSSHFFTTVRPRN